MTPEQAVLVGLIATAIVQGVKIVWIGLLGQPKPAKLVFAVIALVVANALAYYYTGPVPLPDPQADPLAFVTALVVAAGQVFAYASVFHAYILERLLAGLDSLTFARWLKRPLLAP